MNNLQKIGGIAAIIDGLTYIIGFALMLTLLAPYATGELDAAGMVVFITENHLLLHIWHLLIYVVNGVALVVLTIAIHKQLESGAPELMLVATAFGLIWAGYVIASGMLTINDLGVIVKLYGNDPSQAASSWITLSAVENGLGGAVELPGGIWALLVSWAGLKTGGLPKSLNYFGLVIGVAGTITVIPGLADLGAIFGLGFIIWFLWAGIVMIMASKKVTA